MRTEEMIRSHPQKPPMDMNEIATCIRACIECADVCTSCADACLGEEMVQNLVRCIRLNLDCADICAATGRVLTRQTEPDGMILRTQLEACMAACRACALECEQHASMHEHCRICATSCRECEDACRRMTDTLPTAGTQMTM